MKTGTLYRLYLDETGIPSLKTPSYYSPYFILSGILVNQNQNDFLKITADRIKFKYWNNINIVFHSREIGKRENNFSILKDPKIEANFHNDLVNFLTQNQVKAIIVAVDKKSALASGWEDKDIYEKAADEIIRFFIEFLNNKKSRGHITIESASTIKDIAFLKKYSFYLSNGLSSLNLNPKDIKDLLTAISFVSKRNFDIETQIADLLAYPAGYKCMCQDGSKQAIPNSYEDRICNVLQQKLITIGSKNSFIRLP